MPDASRRRNVGPAGRRVSDAAPHMNTRRSVARWAGGALVVAAIVLVSVVGVEDGSSGSASVLIGSVDGTSLIASSMAVALLALTVGIWSVGVPRWMLPMSILGGIAASCTTALAGFALLVASDMTVTPLVHQGCDTGYVAVERSFLFASSGVVYHREGPVVVTGVGRSWGDDGYKPFANGTYAFSEEDGTWVLRYATDSSSVGAGGASPIVLPVFNDSRRECGMSSPAGLRSSSEPTPTITPTPLRLEDVDVAVRDLVADSFAASVGVVVDGAGAPIDASAAVPISASCLEGDGVQREIILDFGTGDNARSVSQILDVWTAAGYDADRAMQEDIRYSETLPVARMSIRDRSSIDGMLHMTITSACVTAE